ncbi:MAG: hypothetical protein ACLP9L_25040 [Thermoguttaceae bacterium]
MAERSLLEEAAGELIGKAVVWVPAIAGTIMLGPIGGVLGFAASVAIVGAASNSSPPGGDQAPRGQNGASK